MHVLLPNIPWSRGNGSYSSSCFTKCYHPTLKEISAYFIGLSFYCSDLHPSPFIYKPSSSFLVLDPLMFYFASNSNTYENMLVSLKKPWEFVKELYQTTYYINIGNKSYDKPEPPWINRRCIETICIRKLYHGYTKHNDNCHAQYIHPICCKLRHKIYLISTYSLFWIFIVSLKQP